MIIMQLPKLNDDQKVIIWLVIIGYFYSSIEFKFVISCKFGITIMQLWNDILKQFRDQKGCTRINKEMIFPFLWICVSILTSSFF